jgi:hypothetical protein
VAHEACGPALVFVNDTGVVPSYPDLASLNQTKIGFQCDSIRSDGTCDHFVYVQETGWWYDAANGIVYIHYVGDSTVEISLFEGASGSVFSTTVTISSGSVSTTTTVTTTVS